MTPRYATPCACCGVSLAVKYKSGDADERRELHLCDACAPQWEYVYAFCDCSWPCRCDRMRRVRKCGHHA